MADTRTMAQRLQAPTGGFEFAIVPPAFQRKFFDKTRDDISCFV